MEPTQQEPNSRPPDPPSGPVESRSWFATHGRDLRFLVVFATLMGLYYVATTTATMKERFFPWYLQFNAQASVGILNACGYEDVKVSRTSLSSSKGTISVERGCDAVEPTALFAAAVLASPVAFATKLPAVVAGALVLAVVNIVRIISLFLSAAHWRKAFDLLHLDVWQAAFIFLSLLLWALWAAWATKRQKRLTGV